MKFLLEQLDLANKRCEALAAKLQKAKEALIQAESFHEGMHSIPGGQIREALKELGVEINREWPLKDLD